jgi:transcriptional regulator with XRE-family HTH domain
MTMAATTRPKKKGARKRGPRRAPVVVLGLRPIPSMTGEEIRAIRETLGMSRREFGMLLGLPSATADAAIYNYDSGGASVPDVIAASARLAAIAHKLSMELTAVKTEAIAALGDDPTALIRAALSITARRARSAG